jgi:hypothetical protein
MWNFLSWLGIATNALAIIMGIVVQQPVSILLGGVGLALTLTGMQFRGAAGALRRR